MLQSCRVELIWSLEAKLNSAKTNSLCKGRALKITEAQNKLISLITLSNGKLGALQLHNVKKL